MPYANVEDRKARQRAYYLEHREERIAAAARDAARRREEDPERMREQKKASNRRAYVNLGPRTDADRAVSREKTREWNAANPERRRQIRAEWQHRNLLAHREKQARRRARLRGNFVEKIDPQLVWERDEGVCGICGEAAELSDWHLDHIVPIARGGEHSYANVQVSHPLCNCRKGAGSYH